MLRFAQLRIKPGPAPLVGYRPLGCFGKPTHMEQGPMTLEEMTVQTLEEKEIVVLPMSGNKGGLRLPSRCAQQRGPGGIV